MAGTEAQTVSATAAASPAGRAAIFTAAVCPAFSVCILTRRREASIARADGGRQPKGGTGQTAAIAAG